MEISRLLCYLGIHLYTRWTDNKEMEYECTTCGKRDNIYYI